MRDVYCKTLTPCQTNKNIVALDADLISPPV